ncbi:hypothetical protein GWK47_002491 [Chionoecetes opilio]|uniref:Uncharacterized protein n=1 Tax=Chionoecetes opilio TaxID=41210 RepID=A0A8J4XMU0_CHIOP|nr:hypothetical protein GWK47_002491 [Chionoecetes opilio]
MATDTKDARMPPAASRYCHCVCDKKRRKHPGVRLQLFPKDARSAISISGDWARCGSRGGQLYHYYRKYGTQWFLRRSSKLSVPFLPLQAQLGLAYEEKATCNIKIKIKINHFPRKR